MLQPSLCPRTGNGAGKIYSHRVNQIALFHELSDEGPPRRLHKDILATLKLCTCGHAIVLTCRPSRSESQINGRPGSQARKWTTATSAIFESFLANRRLKMPLMGLSADGKPETTRRILSSRSIYLRTESIIVGDGWLCPCVSTLSG